MLDNSCIYRAYRKSNSYVVNGAFPYLSHWAQPNKLPCVAYFLLYRRRLHSVYIYTPSTKIAVAGLKKGSKLLHFFRIDTAFDRTSLT